MEKNYFLAKLIPPRPSFTADMNAEERQVMMDHGAFLRKYVEAGTVIVMGPVRILPAHGALRFSGSVPRTRSGPSPPAILPSSPGSVSGGEIYPMPQAVVRDWAGSHTGPGIPGGILRR